jgi:hypothetical protein
MSSPRKYAILIGVEASRELGLKGPDHASADARAMKAMLEGLGYLRRDIIILAGRGATRSAVESRLTTLLARGEAAPGSLFVDLAMPGYSVQGENFLACHDSTPDDPEGSSIKLDWLIQEIRQRPYTTVQIYLDCGWNQSEEEARQSASGFSPLSSESLERSVRDARNLVVFSASRFHEPSYSDRRGKCGIWARHVLDAFSGHEPQLIDADGILRAGDLQRYLADRVPQTLRNTFADRRKTQSPWSLLGRSSDTALAKLPIVSKRSGSLLDSMTTFARGISFTRQDRERVKDLSGFRQGLHHAPRWSSRQAEEFVARIALGEIEEDIANRFAEIRQTLAYRRRQMETRSPEGGIASIRTPDFEYTISVSLDEDPAFVVLTRELSDLRDPRIVLDERMASTFDGVFDSARVDFDAPIDIEDLIDLAESRSLKVSYPPDCRSCIIESIEGATVQVGPTTLVLRYRASQTLERLVRGVSQFVRPNANDLALPSSSKRD